MTQNKRTKCRSPITAILAVLLILAGVAAIAGSLAILRVASKKEHEKEGEQE